MIIDGDAAEVVRLDVELNISRLARDGFKDFDSFSRYFRTCGRDVLHVSMCSVDDRAWWKSVQLTDTVTRQDHDVV